MSGHSHWATIKRKKGAGDAKRGQMFTKLSKEVTLAAREGGDPNTNFKLRLAIDKARANNMPKDSIDRAIKRGTGESKDGVSFDDVMYEGYGPKGVAFMIECLTENRNRTVADVRHVLSRAGGNLGESGSVAWQFNRKSYFLLTGDDLDFDQIFELAAESGADDVEQSEDGIEIFAEVENYKTISDALFKAGLHVEEAELRMIPNQEVELPVEDTLQVLRVADLLDELDDVQHVYHNMSISDEALAALESDN
jgi:YebC/PmpR family DNA-binding regulatory protein